MKYCHACRKELPVEFKKTSRRDVCPFCRVDLHCCRACAFYDQSAPRQCREPVAQMVKEKDKANFCDYFSYAVGPASGNQPAQTEQARKALDDLFKK